MIKQMKLMKQMNKIKRKTEKQLIRFLSICCALLLCFGMVPAEGMAALPDTDRSCSLTLYYTRNGNAFADLDIDIYRVAEADSSGEYRLVEPFAGYPINIGSISSVQESQNTAQTVRQYVLANQIAAYQSRTTDADGTAAFTGLEPGLYMVKGVTVHSLNETVTFQDFMIYLPVPMENGYIYDVEAKPKSSARPDSPSYPDHPEHSDPLRYTVVKLWDDAGMSAQRPSSVEVEILKDGVLHSRVELNSGNNWSYSWDVSQKDGEWSVMELNVPEGYLVTIGGTDTSFTITNSRASVEPSTPDKGDDGDKDEEGPVVPGVPVTPETPGDKPGSPSADSPKTGDTAPMLRYVMLMCVSGLGLMLLSVPGMRAGRNEKKQ